MKLLLVDCGVHVLKWKISIKTLTKKKVFLFLGIRNYYLTMSSSFLFFIFTSNIVWYIYYLIHNDQILYLLLIFMKIVNLMFFYNIISLLIVKILIQIIDVYNQN